MMTNNHKASTMLVVLAMFVATIANALGMRTISTIEMPQSLQMTYLYFSRNGMMWIGTNSGLISYDGYVKHIYRSDASTPGLFPNNSIVSIAEDNDGYLWIGTRNGIVKMDNRTGHCKTYHLPGEGRMIIYKLFVATDNTLYVGTDGGLAQYDRKNDKFVCYGIDNKVKVVMPDGKQKTSTGNFGVKSMAESHDGKYLFVGTWNHGLLRLKRGTTTFNCYPTFGKDQRAFAVHLDPKGRLWIGIWGGELYRMDNPMDYANPQITKPIRKLVDYNSSMHHKQSPIYNIEGVGNQIWVCLRDRVDILDLNNVDGGFTEYSTVDFSPSRPFAFNNWLAADRMGNVWVQERFGRIRLVSTKKPIFQNPFAKVSGGNMPATPAYSIYTDDGSDFWLALLPFGIAHFNRATGSLLFNNQIPEFSNIPNNHLTAAITSIAKRRNGELWMASTSFGIFIVKPGEKTKALTKNEFPGLLDDYVNTIAEHSDGSMWVGTRKGLVIFDKTATSTTNVTMKDANSDFSNCDIRNIFEAKDGSMWIATENEGIIMVGKDKDGSFTFKHYSPNNNRFIVDDATACYEDSRGQMWAISTSGGLFLLDRKRDTFDWVNAKYHIEGSSVYAINEDSHSYLWLATEDALIRLSYKGDVTTFTKEDGIGEVLFLPNSTFKYKNEMYFGSANGFLAFNPVKIYPDDFLRTLPQLIVSDILLDGVPYKSLDEEVRLDLSEVMPDHSRQFNIPASAEKFSIDFALLDYTNPEHNRFAYKLKGYNNEWQYLTAGNHRATFENIPSGTYQLEIKAADRYGTWQTLDNKIEIRVLPPWYASWWAYIIYLGIAVTLVYAGIYFYKENMKTKNRLQMAVVFTNIAHELLTPLTIISANVDSMRKTSPEYQANYDSIQGNINRLTRLLRQILEVRKSQAGQLKLLVGKGSLSDFILRECEIIRPLTIQKGLSLNVDVEPVCGYFDPDKVQKMVQNLLSNAIKYSKPEGKIDVSLNTEGEKAMLKVADDGIGIPKEKMKNLYRRFLDGDYRRMNTMGTGIGLSLTRDLAKLHHGSIHCESQENEGTTFTIIIPISRQSFADNEVDEAMTIEVEAPSKQLLAESLIVTGGEDNVEPSENIEREHSILVVEDNAELLTLMASLLSQQYIVYTARDGQKALNVIAKRELDIVVSDVMIPVMDGIELTRTIKGNSDTAQLPVILLTAKSADEDRSEAYAAGADSYLTKPFKLPTLQQRIDNIIANRERLRLKFAAQTSFDVKKQHYSSPDEVFVGKAIDCVKVHITDGDYDREAFARDMCVSESTLYNKLRAITGQSITGFINSIRLKEACRIARQNPSISINELSMEVGFNTPKYFSKCFKKEFGMNLKEYLESDME